MNDSLECAMLSLTYNRWSAPYIDRQEAMIFLKVGLLILMCIVTLVIVEFVMIVVMKHISSVNLQKILLTLLIILEIVIFLIVGIWLNNLVR